MYSNNFKNSYLSIFQIHNDFTIEWRRISEAQYRIDRQRDWEKPTPGSPRRRTRKIAFGNEIAPGKIEGRYEIIPTKELL